MSESGMNELAISLRELRKEIQDGFKEALGHSMKKEISMPDSQGNQTSLDQVLLELRAIDDRLKKVEHFLTGFIPQ